MIEEEEEEEEEKEERQKRRRRRRREWVRNKRQPVQVSKKKLKTQQKNYTSVLDAVWDRWGVRDKQFIEESHHVNVLLAFGTWYHGV